MVHVHVKKEDGVHDVMILKNSNGGFSFVDLSTETVSPAKYKTEKRVLKELQDRKDVLEVTAPNGPEKLEDAFSTYQRLIKDSVQFKYDDDNDAANHALFMMTAELGKVNDVFQETFRDHELDVRELVDHLGGLIVASTMLMNAGGIRLFDVLGMTISKLAAQSKETPTKK